MPDEFAPIEPQETALAPQQSGYAMSIWNDQKALASAWKAAQMLSKSGLVPETYRNKPEDCLIALDLANRQNLSPMMVMQNLYVVKGKPAWSGSFCAAAINGCGKFTPLEYVFVEDGGGGCFARATRHANGAVCVSDTITMQMAKDEGWLGKGGSKWATMPRQMMMYRAASFFARAHCPEVLLGIQTAEEVQDVKGYEDTAKEVVTISLEGT
jgi:hypothetical protein